MRERISETAKWGDITVGPRIIDASVKARMKTVLKEIESGQFARRWLRESATGKKRYQQLLDRAAQRKIERVGARLRERMPWLEEEP